jgi:tetratricopeptide (TPR) repeat protein
MAERLLHTPMIGLAIAAGALAQWAGKRWRRAAPAVIAFVLLASAGRTLDRSRDWKDEIALFSATVRDTPPSAFRPRHNLVAALIDGGRQKEALPLAREMWETFGARPDFKPRKRAEIATRLALALDRSAKSSESRALLMRALELDSSYPLPCIVLGTAAGKAGNHPEALAWFDRAVAAAPRNEPAHFNRAVALEILERPAEAETEYCKAIELAPPTPRAHLALAALLWKEERFEEAEKVYAGALALWPRDAEIRYWIKKAGEKRREKAARPAKASATMPARRQNGRIPPISRVLSSQFVRVPGQEALAAIFSTWSKLTDTRFETPVSCIVMP